MSPADVHVWYGNSRQICRCSKFKIDIIIKYLMRGKVQGVPCHPLWFFEIRNYQYPPFCTYSIISKYIIKVIYGFFTTRLHRKYCIVQYTSCYEKQTTL